MQEDEVGRQGGPPRGYSDRSGLALGVDASAALGTGGGEDDREPPPDWTRTHEGRNFGHSAADLL